VPDDLERRLRDTLRAYADVVDAPDDDTLPAPPTKDRPRRWRGALLSAAAAAAVVIGSLVVVEVRGSGSPEGVAAGSSVTRTQDTPSGASESASATPSGQALSGADAAAADRVGLPPSPEPGVAYAIDLYTHCGVRGLDINGVWFAAAPPLVVEGSRPPYDWGNPYQPGTVTMVSATEAVFRDDVGHDVQLRADESARPPLCQ
jgi:hypothetical protein